MDPRRVQLLIRFGYNGSGFRGVQPQPQLPTAGGALVERFRAEGFELKALCFAARTDKGVHARENIATCWTRGPMGPENLLAVQAPRADGLEGVSVLRVPIHVHARGNAAGKHYRYDIIHGVGGVTPPYVEQEKKRAWQVSPPLDLAAMNAAAQHFVGEHDFTSFRTTRCGNSDPVKRIYAVEVRADGPGCVSVRVHGRAFLRQMVRIMVGTLCEVGAGLRKPSELPVIMAAKQREAAGVTAPPHGLTLVCVEGDWPDAGVV